MGNIYYVLDDDKLRFNQYIVEKSTIMHSRCAGTTESASTKGEMIGDWSDKHIADFICF